MVKRVVSVVALLPGKDDNDAIPRAMAYAPDSMRLHVERQPEIVERQLEPQPAIVKLQPEPQISELQPEPQPEIVEPQPAIVERRPEPQPEIVKHQPEPPPDNGGNLPQQLQVFGGNGDSVSLASLSAILQPLLGTMSYLTTSALTSKDSTIAVLAHQLGVPEPP